MHVSPPAANLIKVSYCSRSLIPPEQLAGQLSEILASARRHNPRRGITGVLTIKSDCFVQTLEGPEDAVSDLVASISSDPRHDGVLVYERQAINTRRYGAWSMAFTLAGDPFSNLAGVQVDAVFDPQGQDEAEVSARIASYVATVLDTGRR